MRGLRRAIYPKSDLCTRVLMTLTAPGGALSGHFFLAVA